jgi:AcrR family transcriptional regulator
MVEMPRIDAPTVVEHRRRRRAVLLAAARELLVAEGASAVTPARVGEAAGIARNSVYTYFDSRARILAELVEDDFTHWNAQVESALSGVEGSDAKLAAYLRITLELAAAGAHSVAAAIGEAELPAECRGRIAVLHQELRGTLRDIVIEFVGPEADAATTLVQGALDGALVAIEHGAPASDLAEATLRFVRDGLAALDGRGKAGEVRPAR